MRAARRAVVPLLLGAAALGAQPDPSKRWRTIATEHFRVHFTADDEALARRAAVNGEAAWGRLAAELAPPRGPVDVVIADNVDYTNGYATTFPSNRIVLYAHPPVDARSLRFYGDWNELVITHELTHVFHLDRTRGWWRLGQRVFGRNPLLFPNAYSPSWLTEGLAVYYESRLTGYGRLAGTAHRALARSAAQGGHVPALHELSLATSRFPNGEAAYAYGSLVVDYLARTRGPEGVRRLVDRTAAQPLPFFIGRAARASFGLDFEGAWRGWRDSLAREAPPASALPLPGWRELTAEGRTVEYPRWLDARRLVYAANTGREVTAAYEVVADSGAPRRLGRRNGVDASAPLPTAAGGGLVFAQLDFVDPYTLRSDLWVERGGRQRRLTRGARLAAPDARARDGAVVAVQAVSGSTRLARVWPGGAVAPLTGASPDTQWAAPRWSPDGDRLAAVRWTRGGRSDVVVLDTLGGVLAVAARGGWAEADPSWSPDGRRLFFTSDRTGATELWVADVPAPGAEPAEPRRLTSAYAGAFEPQPSPDGRLLAATTLRLDGYHLGVAPMPDTLPPTPAPTERPSLPAARPSDAPARAYAPWRTLWPRYWLPAVGEGDVGGGTVFGATTSGVDVVGRHQYDATAALDARRPDEPILGVSYRFAGFRRPLLDVLLSQDWSHFYVQPRDTSAIALLTRRERTARLAATFVRPRVRTYSYATLGAERQVRASAGSTAELAALLSGPRTTDAAVLGAGWSNTQHPTLAISPENGVSLAASARERWRRQEERRGRSRRYVGVARGYRALDLPGFAHHVLAARLAGGWESDSLDAIDAGGTGGGSLELLPGYRVGGSPETFGARGFPSGAQTGMRAASASVEYRAPLWMPSRGARLLPVFVDRTAATLFTDAASAWCPAWAVGARGRPFCPPGSGGPSWMASVGAELNADVALQYDTPYRFRGGVALPVRGRDAVAAPDAAIGRATVYVTLGLAF